ncbi:MAG: HD family hydrolase [Anaerolineae bacterium]|jgi:putative hydrolase of HD superfamily
MDKDALTELFLEAATLKRVPRTGWGTRGVAYVESVADHSFGVVFMVLTLVDALQNGEDADVAGLDLEKALIMAALHDLAEVRLTDLPSSAVRLIPPAIKSQAETKAMNALLSPLSRNGRLLSLWQEFEDETSPEGKLVRDADKLEMMVQCLRYEQAGERGLDEFWQAIDQRIWHYPLCAELYNKLRGLRPSAANAPLGSV